MVTITEGSGWDSGAMVKPGGRGTICWDGSCSMGHHQSTNQMGQETSRDGERPRWSQAAVKSLACFPREASTAKREVEKVGLVEGVSSHSSKKVPPHPARQGDGPREEVVLIVSHPRSFHAQRSKWRRLRGVLSQRRGSQKGKLARREKRSRRVSHQGSHRGHITHR